MTNHVANRLVGGVMVVWGSTAWLAGCGANSYRDPHQLADATVVKTTDPIPDPARLPQPTFQILSPEPGTSFPVGSLGETTGKIHCVVRLEVPPGGKAPETVFAQLLNRRVLASSIPLTTKEKPGDPV